MRALYRCSVYVRTQAVGPTDMLANNTRPHDGSCVHRLTHACYDRMLWQLQLMVSITKRIAPFHGHLRAKAKHHGLS